MNNVEVTRARQRLDHLFDLIDTLRDEPEIQSHWARYLCVLVSGFLERSIRMIYGSYARSSAAPNVANFVEVELKHFQNPTMGKILELARAFSPDWGGELEGATEGKLKDAVDSIVANKNNIAHGESVGITFTRIKDYYERAVQVLELIDVQCKR